MKTTPRVKWAALLVALSGVAIGAGGCADYYGPPPVAGGYVSTGVGYGYGAPYGYGYGYPGYGYPGYPYYGAQYGYGGTSIVISERYRGRYDRWHHRWNDPRQRAQTGTRTAPNTGTRRGPATGETRAGAKTRSLRTEPQQPL